MTTLPTASSALASNLIRLESVMRLLLFGKPVKMLKGPTGILPQPFGGNGAGHQPANPAK
jgi:hypothetical protein